MDGVVKKLSQDKGHGYITSDASGANLFFLATHYEGEWPLQAGDRVRFELRMGKNGRTEACDVRLATQRHEGVIKWFSYEKGFGFVKTKDSHEDVFVHESAYRGDQRLGPGDEVSFEICVGKNGKSQAIRVKTTRRSRASVTGKPYFARETYKKPGFWASMFGDKVGNMIVRTCLRCDGTGHVTAVDTDHIGFQCEKCGSFWKEKNRENLSDDDVLRR